MARSATFPHRGGIRRQPRRFLTGSRICGGENFPRSRVFATGSSLENASMKHFAVGFFLALFLVAIPTSTLGQMPELKPLKGTPIPPAPKNPEQFKFILAGDNRPAKATDPQGDAVKTIFKEIKKQAPAFVLWTGDIIYGKDPSVPKTITKEYEEFLAIAAKGNAAVYNAPG